MDVRCSRCGTEYELDETRVASTGTPVKCSNCGHVFKVMPGGTAREATTPGTRVPTAETAQPVPADDASAPAQDWSVRRVDGSTLRFRELTTLQKWIVERKVGRDDEISRSGRTWKKLGEIAELTSFFQVVEAADAAQRAAAHGPPPAIDAPSSATTTARFRSLTLATPEPVAAAPAAPPAASSTASSTASSAATSTAPSATSVLPAATTSAPAPGFPATTTMSSSASSGSSVSRNDAGLDELDDDDPVLAWQRRRRQWTVAAITAVVVATAIVAVFALVPSSPRLPPELASRAKAALTAGDDAAQEQALQALADAPSHEAAGWRGRLLAARADAAMDVVRLATVGRALDTSIDVDAAKANANTRVTEATASLVALRATVGGDGDHDGDDDDILLDLADVTLSLAKDDAGGLSRAIAAVRTHASRGEGAGVDDELRLALTLSESRAFDARADGAADALGGVLTKLALFDDVRARAVAVHVAVAHLVAVAEHQRHSGAVVGEDVVASTRALVEKLGATDPRRVLAERIVTQAVAPPTATVGVGSSPGPVNPGSASVPVPGSPGAEAGKPVEALPADYDALMRRGEQALVAERSVAAFESFKKASQLRPGVARPWLKLGWASLDVSRYGEAERAFARALAIDATLAEAQFGLAESLRFAGKKTEALAAYRAYVAMDPGGRDAGIARRVIEELQ
jgi:predicted Zn finger-like uncharacterized protein